MALLIFDLKDKIDTKNHQLIFNLPIYYSDLNEKLWEEKYHIAHRSS